MIEAPVRVPKMHIMSQLKKKTDIDIQPFRLNDA